MTSSPQPGAAAGHKIGFFRNVAQPLSVSGPSAGTAVLPGTMVAVTGTAGASSFLFGLLAGMLVAYVFASLARHFPSAGAPYYYAGILSGTRIALLVGWAYLLTYVGFAGSVLSNEANYVEAAMGYVDAPTLPWPLVAFVLWVCCMIIVLRRIEFNTGFQVTMETLGVLALLVVGIAVLVSSDTGGHGLGLDVFSLSGVSLSNLFLGITIALSAYGGFESGASLSEETEQPGRTVPASMWTSLLLSGALYIFACWFINVGFHGDLDRLAASPSPLFDLAERLFGSVVAFIMTIIVLLAGLSTVTAASTGAIRTLFAMVRDGLLPARRARGTDPLQTDGSVPRRIVLMCMIPVLALSIGFFTTDAYSAFVYVATAAAFMLTTVYFAIALLSVPWFARLRSWLGLACSLMATGLLGYALYVTMDSQTDPILRVLPFVDLALLGIAGVFAVCAGHVVRRMSTSPHWEAGRARRDQLMTGRASTRSHPPGAASPMSKEPAP
ncbi:APC family permease [Streptomyces sp. NPDC051018]|uniref:APC family permease n=1 Tax=Streptomyces sp. NPDC051018 TaxID=3365639 RepID=UPI00379CB000